MDCTVGKPGSFIKSGQTRPITVGVRLSRLENMVSVIMLSSLITQTNAH